jgi:outer membrane lipoprotein SlyB
MKRVAIFAFVLAVGIGAASASAHAKGCIKGALVGSAAGHFAGHGVLGALAGCVAGHHEANRQPQTNDVAACERNDDAMERRRLQSGRRRVSRGRP